MDDAVTTRYFPARQTLVTTLRGALDDTLLLAFARRVIELPEYNRCARRIVDIENCTIGGLTAEGYRRAFGLIAARSVAQVEVTVVTSKRVLAGVRDAFMRHTATLPFTVNVSADRSIIDRLEAEDVATAAESPSTFAALGKRIAETVQRAQDIVGGNAARESDAPTTGELCAHLVVLEERVSHLAAVVDILIKSIADGTADQVALRILREELTRDFKPPLRVVKDGD